METAEVQDTAETVYLRRQRRINGEVPVSFMSGCEPDRKLHEVEGDFVIQCIQRKTGGQSAE